MLRTLSRLGEFVKFSHTIFALPFALASMLVAGRGSVPWPVLGWILGCMVTARTAAMCFNRLIDWDIDKANPRTENRHRLIPKPLGWAVLLLCSLLFVYASTRLNSLCLALSPIALFLILFYSVTKRFTSFSHFFLGLALAVAPVGAWAAVRGNLYVLPPFVLALSVLLWVFGFDLIYATLDMGFDRSRGLHSFPARYGLDCTLRTARILHVTAAFGFILFGWLAGLGWIYGLAWLGAVAALVWEHRLTREATVGAINKAFFQVNAIVGMLLLMGVALDLWIRK